MTGDKLLKPHLTNLVSVSEPFQHWLVDNFLTEECLAEVKSVDGQQSQACLGKRVGNSRLFINRQSHQYPHLKKLYEDLEGGDLQHWFSQLTGIDYASLYPRLEVISDYGDFYLEPHPDQPEKRLTALVYTDYQELYPGTWLVDGSRVPAQDNRCFFFVPAPNTIHGYPHTHFSSVRRALQINYWTYTL